MRFQQSTYGLVVLLLILAAATSDAFTFVLPSRNSRRISPRCPVSQLGAFKGQQLLPPPPPPIVAATTDDANIFEQTLRELQNAVGNLPLPNLDSLREQGSAMSLNSLKEQLASLSTLPNLSSLKDQVATLKIQLDALDANMLEQLQSVAQNLNQGILADNPDLKPVVQQITVLLQPLLQSPTLTLAGSAVITFVLVSSILNVGREAPPQQPYPLNKYDPISARLYFDQRLPMVVARGLEIFVQSLQFGLSLLRDKLDDKIADNEEQRGRELAELLTRLGPTFIKVGQSLSIRTDLLSPGYIRGLETLQDQVPAFSTKVAKQILEKEWGQPISAVLVDDLPDKPVAAAS